MNSLTHTLQRVIAGQYYRKNAPFFLLLVLLLFGIPKPSYVFLSYGFISAVFMSQVWFWSLIGMMIAYCIKVNINLVQAAHLPENRILRILPAQEGREYYKNIFLTTGSTLAPALVYMWLMTGYGLYNQSWLALIPLGISFLSWGLTSWIFSQQLLKPIDDSIGSKWAEIFNRPWLSHVSRVFLSALSNELWRPYVVLKVVGILALTGTFWAYAENPVAEQLTNLLFVGLAIAHCPFIFRIREIEETQLQWLRGLPLSAFRRYAEYIFFVSLLVVPEIIIAGVVSIRFGLPVTLWMHWVGFSLSLLSLFVALTYMFPMVMKPYLQTIFFIFTGCFFLIMIKINFLYIWPLMFGFTALVILTEFWKRQSSIE